MRHSSGGRANMKALVAASGVYSRFDCLAVDGFWLALELVEPAGHPAPRRNALALLGVLARLLAVLAADRERQGPQALLGDLLAALEAVAVGPVLEPRERLVDLVQRLGLHLDEREL